MEVQIVRVMPPRQVQRLAKRERLPASPDKSIAIKRDVHEFIVDTDANSFAAAFRQVMTDPEGMFGLIRVKRAADRLGRAFEPGERFQGCYSITGALYQATARGWRRRVLRPVVALILRAPPVRWLVTQIEDAVLSDYAIIDELVLDPPPGQPHTLKYSYLVGTPIGGSSRFLVEAIGERRCRVTQIFEYQEVNAVALATFQRFGLKMHDQVVHMQIHKAAERAGARVLSGTIPVEYARA
jgi:hypothetical protein